MSPRPDLGPKPHLGYVQSRLERAAELRTDNAAIARLAAEPRAGAYVIGGDHIVMKKGGTLNDPLFTMDEARALGAASETVFLGLLEGAARFGYGIPPAAADALKTQGGFLVTDLRSIAVQGLAEPEHLPPIAEAKAVLHWHARHRFCPNCGAATQAVLAGWRRDCAHCKALHFPRTDPVVIMLAVDGERCLLGRSPRFVPTMWSCLAGFVEPGEAIEDAVRRETREEAGIACGRVVYFGSQPWPFPSFFDDRLPCAGADPRHCGGPRGTRGCPLVQQERGRDHADAQARRWLDHAAAGGDRASHHPRLAGKRDRL